MPESNGWTEWGKHVLSEMERLNGCIETINGRLRSFEIEQTILKVKAGIWGAVAGMIPVAITLLIMFVGGFVKQPTVKVDLAEEQKQLEKRIDRLIEENERLRDALLKNQHIPSP